MFVNAFCVVVTFALSSLIDLRLIQITTKLVRKESDYLEIVMAPPVKVSGLESGSCPDKEG